MLFSKPSVITKALMGAALCLSSTSVYASSAAACQAGQAGCVLPVTDPAAAPAPPMETSAPIIEESSGIGILPIIAVLALAGLALILLLDDDEEEISPE